MRSTRIAMSGVVVLALGVVGGPLLMALGAVGLTAAYLYRHGHF